MIHSCPDLDSYFLGKWEGGVSIISTHHAYTQYCIEASLAGIAVL